MMSKKSKRSIVISVRLDDTSLAAVDLLVNSGLAQSRSEAASQFIGIGVQSSEALIVKAKVLEENVRVLKKEMLDVVTNKSLGEVSHLLQVEDKLQEDKTPK